MLEQKESLEFIPSIAPAPVHTGFSGEHVVPGEEK